MSSRVEAGVPQGLEPDGEGVVVTLRDGGRILARAIRHEDRERLIQGLKWLSPRSRYLRFHSAINSLSPSQLDYLVDVDHSDHDAIVALDIDAEDRPGVGVARYIRLKDEPSVAEAAVTVIDDQQGRGIGTVLVRLLERVAAARGVETFRNYVLAENQTMLEIFGELGSEVTRESASVLRVDVPLRAGRADALELTPATEVLTTTGRERVEAPAWSYPLAWLLRHVPGIDSDDEASLLGRLLGEEDEPAG